MHIREVIYPFYIISTLFGYTYFDLPVKSSRDAINGRQKVRQQFMILVYVAIGFGNVILNIQQIYFAKYFAKNAFSTVTGQRLSSGLFTCTGVLFILTMIHSFCYRREARMIVDKFVQFDQYFEKHLSNVSPGNHHRRVVIGYITCTVFVALVLLPTSHVIIDDFDYGLPFSIEFLIFGYASTLNYAFLQSHTILSVSAVLVRLRVINRELGRLMDQENSWRTVGGNVLRVQQCRYLHDIINDIVELINLCFGFSAMWCTLACFGFSIMSMYSNYEILTREDKSWQFVFVNFAWNCFYAAYSICIVIVASWTKKEANRTATLVHKIINANMEPILTDEVHHLKRALSVLIRVGDFSPRRCQLFVTKIL